MMKKSDYSPVGMHVTMKEHDRTFRYFSARLHTLTNCLDLDRPGSWHCHDELDSNLAALIEQLEAEVERLKNLRQYTLYPSVTQQERVASAVAVQPAQTAAELIDDLFLTTL